MVSRPSVSIVVANKNHGQMLRRSLESYESQTFDEKIIICIDGNSIDESLEVVSCFPNIIVYSEEDKSGAEAFSKGIMRVTTKYIVFGNATDFLIDRSFIAQAVDLLERNERISLVFGNVTGYNSILNSFDPINSYGSNHFGNYRQNFIAWLVSGETFHEHACVIRTEVLDVIYKNLQDYFESIDKLGDDLFLTLRYRFHACGFRSEFIPLNALGVVDHENRVSVDQRKYFLRHLEFYNLQMKQFRRNFIKKGHKFVSIEGDDAEVMGSIPLLKLKLFLIYLEVRGFLGNLYRRIFK